MFPNARPTDLQAVIGTVDPISQGAGTASTAWVPVQNFHTFLALIATGVLGTAATVDAKIQQAQDSSGTGAKDITGKAITQIVKATGDGKQALINFRPQDLDTNGAFTHVRLSITVGAAASLVAGVLLGVGARYDPPVDSSASPAINLGASTVAQIV